MKKTRAYRIVLAVMTLALILPGFITPAARAEISMAIDASVSTEGISVQEGYTLRMTAADASCPMPGGNTGGTYDLSLAKPGLASFPAMTFTDPGNYLYTIRQVPGNHALALSYDSTVYDLRVQVREADGKLQLTAIMNREGSDKKAASADFVNKYLAPAVIHNPPVRKTVTGDQPTTAATFKFQFKPVSNTAGLSTMPMPEGSANGLKTISTIPGVDKEFGEMTFEVPGKYVYEITEVNDGQQGYAYDSSVYTLTYAVERSGEALTCTLTTTKDGMAVDQAVFAFMNKYKGATPTTTATAKPTATATAKPTATATAKPTATATAKPTATATAKPTATPTSKPSGGGGGGGGGSPRSTPVPMTEITGTKVWVDGNNEHRVRPGSINIHLFADDTEVDATPTWTKSGNVWTYSFGRLPTVDEYGSTLSYTVTEDSVQYYTTAVNGLTVTNTIEEREPSAYTEISGQKTWKDSGSNRPTNITIRLLRDGEAIEQRIVSAGTDWKYSFQKLPVDDGYGHTYTYTIQEDGVKGYFARYSGFDVVNTKLGTPTDAIPPEGTTPDESTLEEELAEERHTGTPIPRFWLLTHEQLENLLNLWGYRVPRSGKLLATGDKIPWWVFGAGTVGVMAILLLLFTRKRKR